MKVYLLLLASCLFASCQSENKQQIDAEIDAIIKEYNNNSFYEFQPYFSADIARILTDSRELLTVKCENGNLTKSVESGTFSDSELKQAMNTFNFCRKFEIYSITKYLEYDMIETSLKEISNNRSEAKTINIVLIKKNRSIDSIRQFENEEYRLFKKNIYLLGTNKYKGYNTSGIYNCSW